MIKRRTFFYTAAALAAALTLTSCAGGSPAASPSTPAASETTATFNDADVTFAQAMLPHHEQAVEMSDDVLAKDDIDEDVRNLATDITMAQEPEIAQLEDWLSQWGTGEHNMSDMGGMNGMDGMMSSDDMAMLQDAAGAEASKLFLEQMTVHHEGAVDMAQSEIDKGQNADAQAMAATIVTTQTAEIAVMADLLATL
ncbi:DUF305 domain-containing protein [Cryobacterium melibiosiphilum]|uniref:DUF305 domain-containing protein n=1 Tax=Cryobacterium melibiosiphilum TaxID=995039 RepID=A0A3A5MH92_9MICO|nr:DUF305 domain-containing protein [Cryobacterium melibiosiphilum]RJT84761.1 DUF305 domain-containing protein [Cryobacterium melibiosiphilum]